MDTTLPEGKGERMKAHLAQAALLPALVPLLVGCTSPNPEWATSLNPCCGQDEVLEGKEPSESRCADMVISRESVMDVAWRVAAGSGMSRWRVRLLPGGPACIWRKYPGLTDEDYEYALTRPEADSIAGEAAASDSAARVDPEVPTP
jgi:hypothetical protein